MKKNRLFSLLCAFCPGAGEMYMGLLKRGASIMLLFWGIVALCTLIPYLMFLLPVIWFFSFFETLNLRNMTWAQLDAVPDDPVLSSDGTLFGLNLKEISGRFPVVIGWGFILIGAYLIYDRFLRSLVDRFLPWLSGFFWALPSLLLGVAIILFGVYLIRGKKLPEDSKDDVTFYGGGREQSNDKEDLT